jgi:hypothetical protein
MAFNRLALEFPRLAAELERLSGDDVQVAAGRIVETALTTTGVQVTDRSPAAVNTLVWSLDDVAWSLQEAVDKGAATQLDYVRAFRRARAANSLLDLLENRYDSAVYEAAQALSANEDAVLQLLAHPT